MNISLTHAVIVLASLVVGLGNKDSNNNENNNLKTLILSTPARGHLNNLLILSQKLASHGHNVTFIIGTGGESLLNSQELEELVSKHNAHFIPFESTVASDPQKNLDAVLKEGQRLVKDLIIAYAEELTQHSSDILSTQKFDVIIGDEFVVGPLMCINSQWNIPAVIMGVTMPFLVHEQPSWAWPGMLLGHSSDDLTFSQRIISLVEKVILKQVFNYLLWSPQYYALLKFCPSLTKEQLYEAPGVHLPHIVPTVIGFEYPRTSTPLTSYVRPLVPDHPPPLSENPNLEEWLENQANETVVYLSMGSMFPVDKITAGYLVEGVMKAKYNLLWSLRKSNQWILEDLKLDKNRVYISEWTPQFSVLASKAIHSAILHGGFNGLSEALWNCVPIIGFPQMFEQILSVGRLYHNKYGVRLDKETLTSSKVTDAIVSIDKGNYRSNLRKLRKMFELGGGLNRSVELVEFYGREGYAHLIPAYAKYQWSWIQYYNLDVWLLLATGVGLFTFFVIKFFKCSVNCICKTAVKQKTA